MWTKNITIIMMVIGIILVIPGIIGLVLSVIDQLSKNLIYAELTLVLLGLFFFILGLIMNVRIKQDNRIKREGIPGKAKILKWWIVAKSGGASMDLIERIGFQLEITTNKTPPYQIKHTQLIPLGVYNRFSTGIILPVKIDQKNPRRVVLM